MFVVFIKFGWNFINFNKFIIFPGRKNRPFLELLFLFQRRQISKDGNVVMNFSLFFFITQRDFLYTQLLKLCAHRNNDRIWNSRSALFVADSHFGRFFRFSMPLHQLDAHKLNPFKLIHNCKTAFFGFQF